MEPKAFNFPKEVSNEMVRAILDGRKSVTRRVVKPQPVTIDKVRIFRGDKGPVPVAGYQDGNVEQLHYPYIPGDILYVRETWTIIGTDGTHHKYGYKADNEQLVPLWRPSIHMPKEAARLFLRVTGVRVERLWDITEEQAEREGLYRGWCMTERSSMATSARQAFMWIWDTPIKKADLPLYGWAANPWVWVIEFERCERPEGAQNQ